MFYQGTGKIEIIVRKESGAGDVGNKEQSADDVADNKKNNWNTNIFGSNDPNRIKRVVKTNATHFLAVTKQVAGLAFEFVIGGIGYTNGDQSLQERVSRQMEVIQDATGFASSVAMGAIYGAWGGPIGSVLGATMGAVSSAASLTSKYANRQRDYDYKIFKENNAIEYQRSRANINLTTGRLR